MSTRIQDLAPGVRDFAESAIADLKTSAIPAVVTSTNRTALDQITFYLQSRATLDIVNLIRKYQGLRLIAASENINPVTWCDGVNMFSNHQGGKALDVVPADPNGNASWPPLDDPRWRKIAEVMKRHGFAWGGDWPPGKQDFPHYEMV